MVRESSAARQRNWKRIAAIGALAVGVGCGGNDSDLVPTGFEFTRQTRSTDTNVVIVVVDDRGTEDAINLRADLGAGVRHIGAAALAKFELMAPDRAAWNSFDLRVVIVPASAESIIDVASPARDPALAVTTHRLTLEANEVLVRAVEDAVRQMKSAPSGAPFRPLERVRGVLSLVLGERAPADDAESALVASTSAGRLHRNVAVSVLATTDDESPELPLSYRVSPDPFLVPMHVVTPEGRGKRYLGEPGYPRLSLWAIERFNAWLNDCADPVDPPIELFMRSCLDAEPWCDSRPIEEISPGVGRCRIRITTKDPPFCDASRGWADPLESDGVRRPHVDSDGMHACEALPVDARAMDACIHDAACSDCGSGWCLSDVRPSRCPGGQSRTLRWVGGVLPEPGYVNVRCGDPPPRTHATFSSNERIRH
jgi:hypothetical protein